MPFAETSSAYITVSDQPVQADIPEPRGSGRAVRVLPTLTWIVLGELLCKYAEAESMSCAEYLSMQLFSGGLQAGGRLGIRALRIGLAEEDKDQSGRRREDPHEQVGDPQPCNERITYRLASA